MNHQNMLHPELIFLDVDAEDRKDLYHQISEKLLKGDYIKSSYEMSLNKHEDERPTGLTSDLIAIALPHGSTTKVTKPFIAVVTTKEPIPMLQMGYNTEEYSQTFFFLGVTESTDQLILLQKFMSLIQDQHFIDYFNQITDPATMFNYLYQVFK